MTFSEIDNLRLTPVKDDILLVHQIKSPGNFSTCDGLLILPKEGRNSKLIVLDVNITPNLSKAVIKEFGPVSDYVFTHGHLDHSSHVYGWERLGAIIHAPKQEAALLLDLQNFYEGFGFNQGMEFSVVQEFGAYNHYNPCKSVSPFESGTVLRFEEFQIETIHLPGHSMGHTGFLLPREKIIHISCLGFDLPRPKADGFGPWYGFEKCSIPQYLKDVDLAEKLFLERAEILTSSHSYIVNNPDITPFSYIRNKIEKNQELVDQAILSLKSIKLNKITTEDLLELDLFFPKKKMRGFLLTIYNLWESWIIKKHVERSKVI